MARPDADIRRVVQIDTADGTFYFCDGETSIFDYPPSVLSVNDGSFDLDDFTGETTVGEHSVTFRADGAIKALLRANFLIGQLMTIHLGTPAMNDFAVDFIPYWCGTIKDVTGDDKGELTVHGQDGFGYLSSILIKGGWISQHPTEIVRDIMANSATAGVSDSRLGHVPPELWDEDSFQWRDDTAISHWNLSRWEGSRHIEVQANYTAAARGEMGRAFGQTWLVTDTKDKGGLLDTPAEGWGLIQELLVLSYATARTDEQGRLTQSRFTGTGLPVRHWTRNKVANFRLNSIADKICNSLEIEVGASSTIGHPSQSGHNPPSQRTYRIEDPNSQLNHAAPGWDEAFFQKSLTSPWLRVWSVLFGSVSSSATTISVYNPSMLGFCGARWAHGYRSANSGGIVIGGALTASVSVTSNVATATLAAGYQNPFIIGAWLTTSDMSVNAATAVQVTAVTPTTVSYPLVTADGALADGVGYLNPEQYPEDQINPSAGRYGYLLVMNADYDQAIEFMRVTAISATSGLFAAEPGPQAIPFPLGSPYTYPSIALFTVERGHFGSTALPLSDGAVIYDITIAVQMAQDRIRFTNGLPVVSLSTPMSEADIQLGDLISFDHPACLFEGCPEEGATSDVVWRPIAKKLNGNRIDWTLGWVYQTTPSVITPQVPIVSVPENPVEYPGVRASVYFHSTISNTDIRPETRYLETPYNAAAMDLTNALTLSCWIYLESLVGGSPMGRYQGGQHVWRLAVTRLGALRLYVASSVSDSSNYITTNITFQTARWMHVMWSVLAGSSVLVVDGVVINTTTTGSIPASFTTGTSVLQIGAAGDGTDAFGGSYIAHPAICAQAMGSADNWNFRTVDNRPRALRSTGLGLRNWWPFPRQYTDVIGHCDLVAAGYAAIDPIFSNNYPGP